MNPSVEDANQKKEEADRLMAEAEREEADAKQRAVSEKLALDAERERELARIRDDYDEKKKNVDYRYGLAS